MKGQESQDALWQGIKDGFIDVIATDHCPFRQEQKDWGKDDFTKIPNGCMGIETLYPYMLSQARAGRISFEKAVELCAENPARIFGCQNKGALEPGKMQVLRTSFCINFITFSASILNCFHTNIIGQVYNI